MVGRGPTCKRRWQRPLPLLWLGPWGWRLALGSSVLPRRLLPPQRLGCGWAKVGAQPAPPCCQGRPWRLAWLPQLGLLLRGGLAAVSRSQLDRGRTGMTPANSGRRQLG
jgi:hypothetical protein